MTTKLPADAQAAPRRAIRNRLLFSVAVLVASSIVLTVLGQVMLSQMITSIGDESRRTNEIADAQERIHLALTRQQTLVLGQALTDEAAAERFEDAVDAELDAYLELARIAPDDEAIVEAAANVRALATEWRDEWAEPFLRAPDGADGALAFDEGERLFAPVEEALVELDRVTEARLDAELTELTGVAEEMNRFFVPIVVVLSVVITVAGLWLVRSISGPLQRLNATARALIAGDEVTFAPERDDEIGALARVLEMLRVDASTRYASTLVQAETAATFNQLSELTSFAQDEPTLVDAASRVLQRIAPSPRGTIMLLNNSTNRLTVAAAWGDVGAEVGSVADLPRIDACPGIRRATAYVAADLTDALAVRCPAHPAQAGSVACLPMPALGSTVGVIHLERPTAHAFDGDTVARTARIAEQVALAIANARLMKTMEGLANTDPLTGLRNPRFFDAHLEQEFTAGEREGTSLGLIMLDVDHFKKFNDTYGHPAGDEALRSLARTLRSVIRAGDVVARYGGEEFVIALHGSTLADAQLVAEKIRLAVEQAAFEIGPGRYARITVSLGVVATDAHPVEQKSLVALADAALYRAKEAGRNRVETAPTSTGELERAAGRRRADGSAAPTAAEPPMAPEPVAIPFGRRARGPRRRPAGSGGDSGNGRD